MFLSLNSSPGHPHTFISPPHPGRLAMIVTEYMENGSLDAFLRVCWSPLRGRVHGHHYQPHRWGALTCCSHTGVEFISQPLGLAAHVHGEEVGMRESQELVDQKLSGPQP